MTTPLVRRLKFDISKNVGIGTNRPRSTLDVSGSIVATDINFTGNLLQNGILFSSGGGGGSSQWSNGLDLSIYYNTGNVGIGSSNPSSKLDISGNVLVRGNITPADNITYDLGSSNNRWRDLYLSGNTIDLGGTRIQRNSNGKGIKVIDIIGNTLDSTFKDVLVDGSIGIGTITPLQKLDVSGNALIRGNISGANISASGNISGANISASGNISGANISASGDISTSNINFSGNLYQNGVLFTGSGSGSSQWSDGSNNKIYYNSGNVGIGSSNPNTTLDVSGNAFIRGNISGANISASGNISGANISASGDISASNINFSGNLYQNGVLFTGGGGSSQWSDGSNNTIYYNTGNIGIGTTIPTNKLDVRGNMDISGNIIPKHNITYDLGSSDYRWRDLYLSGNTIDLGGTRIKRNSNGKGIKVIDDIGNTVNSTFKDVLVDGNIGIGTNTPLQQLDVSGNSLFRGNVGIGNDTPIVALDVSGNVFIRGNVGIGSNNPSQTLDVSGNVKAASFLGDGSQLTNLQIPITLGGALSDETTALTTENSLTLFSPYDINIRSTKLPKFTINTAATATITFDVTVNGSTIYNTKPTITTGNKISSGGVLITNPTTVLEDTVIIASVNSIGSGGTGAKVYIYSL